MTLYEMDRKGVTLSYTIFDTEIKYFVVFMSNTTENV